MAANQLELTNIEISNTLGEMAANIAIQNFDYRCATLLFINSSLYIGVESFLHLFHYNIVINKGPLETKLSKITRQYVIINTDIHQLKALLQATNELKMKNTNKFIIVCQSKRLNECDEQRAIRFFWEYRIINVVFIKLKVTETAAYTYFPVSEGLCNNVNPVKLNLTTYPEEGITKHQLFSMKIRKLNFCTLIVSTFIQIPYMNITDGKPHGADGDLLRIIAYGLNASVKMMTPHRGDGWGFREKNGTWMGSLADLNSDLANISMTSPAITLTRFSDFEISRSYYIVHVVWITHPPTFQNEAVKLLRPFGYSTRIALFVSYLLVIIFAIVFRNNACSTMFLKSQTDQSLKSVVFFSWMICMGQSVIKLPTKSILLQATYIWIYYCFIVRTMYQVYLISSLKGKFYEDQFETIEDAIEANYPFGGGLALQDYYIDHPTVYNNWVNVQANEMLPMIFKISKGMKFVLAMNWDTAKMIMKKHKVSLYVLPQKIISSPTGIFFKKYSVLAESINLILSRIIAGGFPEKLHNDYTNIHRIKSNGNESDKLKLIHFTACYVILIIGSILSIILFILEIYFGKFHKQSIFSP